MILSDLYRYTRLGGAASTRAFPVAVPKVYVNDWPPSSDSARIMPSAKMRSPEANGNFAALRI
jgi:hypothetical protein